MSKASNLQKMQNAGLPVPPFLTIEAKTVNDWLQPLMPEIREILEKLPTLGDAQILEKAQRIQLKIKALRLHEKFLQPFLGSCQRLFGPDFQVAVRSSVSGEDGSGASFAGQHDTFLNVSENDLEAKILAVAASAFNANALKYRLLRNLPTAEIQTEIVVQKMVDAEKSGIAFSMNPRGNLADALIVAGLGLGEGIVSDRVETEQFTVNRQNLSIEKRPSPNAQIQNPKSKILNNNEVLALAELVFKAEKLLAAPADVEFSFDKKGQLHALQMRPITALNPLKIKVLDNTNIVESYPGLTLPLSFGFAKNAYEKVFSAAARTFCLPGRTRRELADVFPDLLAHFGGRVYYRLDNWYRLAVSVYGSRRAVGAWEKAVGLAGGQSGSMRFSFWKKLRTMVISAWLLLNVRIKNRRFFTEFDKNIALLRDFRRHLSSPENLWHHYETATERLFQPWPQTLVNDFLAFKTFGFLQDLLKKHRIGEAESLANDLLCGQRGVESEMALLSMLELKEMVNADPRLSALFALPAGEILAELGIENAPVPPCGRNDTTRLVFAEKLQNHLERFGDRTLEELKLETKSPRAHPEIFIKMLQSQLNSPTTAANFRQKQAEIRARAKAKVAQKLKRWQPQTWLFWLTRNLAAYGLKNRENMRFCRTRAYAAVKDVFQEIGKMMAKNGVLESENDVFWLQPAELQAFCLSQNLEPKTEKVADLKAQFQHFKTLKLPDRVAFLGDTPPLDWFSEKAKIAPPENEATFTKLQKFRKRRTSTSPENVGQKTLRGIGVSGGKVVAPAIIIEEPRLDAEVRGKILVSKMTDPGWVFLMAQAVGLVSEKGSLLSHTAIVGRELGIPVVVGVADATVFFENGDVLELDGEAGTVTLGCRTG